jgi:peptidoglycan glycosyltransferase
MNRALRRVGFAVVVMLLALVGQLTYLQVVDAKKLANDPRNFRSELKNFNQPRGEIISADGKILARSIKTNGADAYKYQRVYPFGSLMAQTIGYQSVTVGNTGMEASYNSILNGDKHPKLNIQDIGDLLIGKQSTANVVSSLRPDVTNLSKQQLANNPGSIVVLNPRTGAVISMYSNPSFDPQPLTGHNGAAVNKYFQLLTRTPGNPALPRAYQEIYPPGSTFKIVTTATGLEAPLQPPLTPSTDFGTFLSFTPPQAGQPIRNFNHEACGGTLEESFVESCNVTFARLGLELGEFFPPGMANFGIFKTPPIDLPGAATSTGPEPGSFQDNKPSFALSGIGQGPVAATPLQMALVASAVANDGVIMAPHVGACIESDDGRVLERINPSKWTTAMSASTAATIKQFMIEVVQRGTGTRASINGVVVAGKTGTAQKENQSFPEAWFVGFAPADNPQYAVAVLLEHTNKGDAATGGAEAAPLAGTMLQYLLANNVDQTVSARCTSGG